MPEAEKNKSREAEIQAVESFDDEAEHNLFGFFSLLLKVDMRNNPDLYKKPKEQSDD